MYTTVRVTMRDTNQNRHGPFTFDLVIDDETKKVIGSHWYYGHSIAPNKDLWPVILKKGGRNGRDELDFGAGARDHGDAIWWTDLRERPIKLGQHVAVWDHNDDECEFIIDGIVPMNKL